jgi:hypothetical protein
MVYRILLVGWLHHKNLNALMKYKGIEVTNVNTLPDLLDSFDLVYCPSSCVDVSLYPGVHFVFGPHLSIFPDASQLKLIRGSVYLQPSSWVLDFWKGYDCCKDIRLRVLPFGVDTELFRPLTDLHLFSFKTPALRAVMSGEGDADCASSMRNGVKKDNVFIYFKRRKPQELLFVENILNFYNVPYRIFAYGSYSEVEYIEYLKGAKYGIWLDAHESQGFALEEALSMNVPLLVWNIRVMSQEYGSSYPHIVATTIPYWDDSCGEVVYDWEDFTKVYSVFLSKLDSYRPREFVIKGLSVDVCSERFLDLVREVIV